MVQISEVHDGSSSLLAPLLTYREGSGSYMGERKFKMQTRTLTGIAAVNLSAILVIGILVGKCSASGSPSTKSLREQRSYKLFSGISHLQTLKFSCSHATSYAKGVHRAGDPRGRRLVHVLQENQHDLISHTLASDVCKSSEFVYLKPSHFSPETHLYDLKAPTKQTGVQSGRVWRPIQIAAAGQTNLKLWSCFLKPPEI